MNFTRILFVAVALLLGWQWIRAQEELPAPTAPKIITQSASGKPSFLSPSKPHPSAIDLPTTPSEKDFTAPSYPPLTK